MKKYRIITTLLGLMALHNTIKAENQESFFQWLLGSSKPTLHHLEVYNDLPVEVTVTPMCWTGVGEPQRIAPGESVNIVSPCEGHYLSITDGFHECKFASEPGNQAVVIEGRVLVNNDPYDNARVPFKLWFNKCDKQGSPSIVNECYKKHWAACREACYIQARADEVD